MKFSELSYFDGLKNICVEYLYKNYDYCYLSAMHEKNRVHGADTIIVGSSHAMNGIIERELYNAGDVISYCISSQDLFYDYEHVKKALIEGKRPIKRCIINLGYYTLHNDISKSELVRSIIPKTYLNLFGTKCMHHFQCEKMDLFEGVISDHYYYPLDGVAQFVSFWATNVMLEQSSFYGDLLRREDNNMLGVQKVDWKTLSEEERMTYARNRTENGHNKHIKYTDSRLENEGILREMVSFLCENGIKIYFLITPYTKAYMQCIEPRYQPDIFQLLDRLPYPVEFLDMNSYVDIFSDADFVDSDHLNLQGAHKATAVLNSYIKMAEE